MFFVDKIPQREIEGVMSLYVINKKGEMLTCRIDFVGPCTFKFTSMWLGFFLLKNSKVKGKQNLLYYSLCSFSAPR